jgi:hypothetical protein
MSLYGKKEGVDMEIIKNFIIIKFKMEGSASNLSCGQVKE